MCIKNCFYNFKVSPQAKADKFIKDVYQGTEVGKLVSCYEIVYETFRL